MGRRASGGAREADGESQGGEGEEAEEADVERPQRTGRRGRFYLGAHSAFRAWSERWDITYLRVAGTPSAARLVSARDGARRTRADISGRLDNPNVKPMEVIVHLIQNAFFKAILPGLQRETKRPRA